jgi:hypothetical protein
MKRFAALVASDLQAGMGLFEDAPGLSPMFSCNVHSSLILYLHLFNSKILNHLPPRFSSSREAWLPAFCR